MANKLKKLEITKVDLCKHGADPDADILIFKSRDYDASHSVAAEEDTSVPQITKPEDIAKATSEQITAYVDQLEKTVASQEAELAKAAKPGDKKKKDGPDPDAPDSDVMKNLPEAIRKRFDEQAVEIRKANERADKAVEDVRKADERAELVELRKHVETEMPKIPGTVTEVAKMLQEAKATLTAPSYAVLEKALKAGSEAITKATQEVGSGGGDAVGTAQEEIFKKADEMVAKGECKTRPEAIQKVAQGDAALYERYKAESKRVVDRG